VQGLVKVSMDDELIELCQSFDGLEYYIEKNQIKITGVILFHAHFKGLDSIEDWFEIEIIVPKSYPVLLPTVKELQGKIQTNYEHLYANGTFCLTTPLEERMTFNHEPTLLSFVNNLVIPYLYSYCYWKKYDKYPFKDRAHGWIGLFEHYVDIFKVEINLEFVDRLQQLEKYGYRGHHPCPCGSGIIIRKCHKDEVTKITKIDTMKILSSDLKMIRAGIKKLLATDN